MSIPTLASLDSSLYPQVWEQQTFTDAHSLLIAMLMGNITPDTKAFTQHLLANDIYQQWINFTVFGGYLQRNFIAFYRQTEDSFNADMPALFRRELIRHAQYLPLAQTLFLAGNMPKSAHGKWSGFKNHSKVKVSALFIIKYPYLIDGSLL